MSSVKVSSTATHYMAFIGFFYAAFRKFIEIRVIYCFLICKIKIFISNINMRPSVNNKHVMIPYLCCLGSMVDT